MKKLISILLTLFSTASFASEPVTLDWQHLRPETTQTQVTLPDLAYQHKLKLQRIFTLMHSSNPQDAERIEEIKAELKKEDIDADALLQMREEYIASQKRAAETITTKFDGQKVRIPGFLVPIEFSNAMVATEFLLVPVAGACIHMPPPPANQIVRVSYPEGYEMRTVQYPVWVEGTINSRLKTENVYIVDGASDITMGYSLSASKVVDYQ